jgi:multicomponent Na+:H+ antiporter subunit F
MTGGLLTFAVSATLAILALAFVLAFVRLLRGPSLPDRVVALDLMASLAVGIMAVTAIGLDAPSLLQPALVLAFVAFLGTVAFARYVEKTGSQQEDK